MRSRANSTTVTVVEKAVIMAIDIAEAESTGIASNETLFPQSVSKMNLAARFKQLTETCRDHRMKNRSFRISRVQYIPLATSCANNKKTNLPLRWNGCFLISMLGHQ